MNRTHKNGTGQLLAGNRAKLEYTQEAILYFHTLSRSHKIILLYLSFHCPEIPPSTKR